MCNRWCLDFAARALPHLAGRPRTLEVGSLDVNGTVRDVLAAAAGAYHGVDIRPGPGVDEVLDVTRLADRFAAGEFDLVATTEMLEHCRDWQEALFQMLRVLRPGGLLVLTTRSPGFPLHDHPADHWRFSGAGLRRILEPVARVLDAQDDFSLGWPCGIGVIARREADEAALARWRVAMRAHRVPAVDPQADVLGETNSRLMPFHLYAGYRACADAIEGLGIARPRVLDDGGGGPPRLRLCAPRLEVVTDAGDGVDCAAAVVADGDAADLDARVDRLAAAARAAVLVVAPVDEAARVERRLRARGLGVATGSRGHVAWSRLLRELARLSAEDRATADLLAPLLADANRRLAAFDHLEPGDARLVVGVRGRPVPRLPATAEGDYREAARQLGEWLAAVPVVR
jgi:SAM-dependent methyltransferase